MTRLITRTATVSGLVFALCALLFYSAAVFAGTTFSGSTTSGSTISGSTISGSTTGAGKKSSVSDVAGNKATDSQPAGSTPQALLTQFFQQRLAGIADDVTVSLKTALSQWPACDQPQLSLPGGKAWGELSVTVSCGRTKRFMRVSVQAKGNYVVAASAIPRGSVLNSTSVRLRHGLLNNLPPQTLLSIDEAQDAVTLRNLAPGQPVQRSLLRQAWRVRAGQQVQVIINQPGFSASGTGQALDNGAVSQNVRVRMSSGTIVSGRVSEDGSVLLTE